MKSITFAVLLIIAIVNSVFAQYNTPQYNNPPPQYNNQQPQYNNPPPQYNNAPQQYNNAPQQYNNTPPQYNNAPQQNNNAPQQYNNAPQQYNNAPQQYNNVPQTNGGPNINQPALTEYEKEQAVIQSQMAPPAPQDAQPAQPVQQSQTIPQETQTVAPVQETQAVEQSVPNEEKEGSSHAGTLAITGVAFALIVGVGYKNYRKDSKFKLPEMPVIPGMNNQNEPSSKEVVVEMEVLLSETSDAENYSLAKNRAYKCMVSWTPKQSDEIILRRGDLVCVKECFNDGYTLGRNLSTKFDGVFPTCCLCRPEQNIIGCELVKNGKFTAIPKRVSSKSRQERRARRASRGVSFLSSVPGWNKAGFSSLPQY